jgi:hypothetical protein
MSYMAGMFLIFCSEFDSFKCFTTFICSHYFLPFFRGAMSDIRLRINYFNEKFRKFLPELFKYFETLDLTSDHFLFEWLVTLYSKSLDIDITARIWDNFLLEGEIYAIKVALSLLRYFEYILLSLTNTEIVSFLKDLHGKIDEEKLFRSIDEVKLNAEDYYEDIKKQKFGVDKCEMFESLI